MTFFPRFPGRPPKKLTLLFIFHGPSIRIPLSHPTARCREVPVVLRLKTHDIEHLFLSKPVRMCDIMDWTGIFDRRTPCCPQVGVKCRVQPHIPFLTRV